MICARPNTSHILHNSLPLADKKSLPTKFLDAEDRLSTSTESHVRGSFSCYQLGRYMYADVSQQRNLRNGRLFSIGREVPAVELYILCVGIPFVLHIIHELKNRWLSGAGVGLDPLDPPPGPAPVNVLAFNRHVFVHA